MLAAKDDHTLIKSKAECIISIGGKNKASLNDCELYDPRTKKWNALSPLNVRRHVSGAVCFWEGYLYVFGGCCDTMVNNCAEIEKGDYI